VKRRILLIEDDLFLGELLIEALQRFDNVAVTWFVRARPTAIAGSIEFIDVNGAAHSFADLAGSFDLAFCDWRLKMSPLSGVEVTRALSVSGLKVIASSGLSTLNDELIAAGAHSGIDKDKLFSRALKEPDFIEKLCPPRAV
jgi:hypothetical protein